MFRVIRVAENPRRVSFALYQEFNDAYRASTPNKHTPFPLSWTVSQYAQSLERIRNGTVVKISENTDNGLTFYIQKINTILDALPQIGEKEVTNYQQSIRVAEESETDGIDVHTSLFSSLESLAAYFQKHWPTWQKSMVLWSPLAKEEAFKDGLLSQEYTAPPTVEQLKVLLGKKVPTIVMGTPRGTDLDDPWPSITITWDSTVL